ncbi:hypothetical protein [Streptomyces nitrosporeus]|uniref:deoxynucleotide monophosphate kinase family protein n=1 Tax=Streptomyces nitrosporeus TaxID=28894 RepID=UPI00331958FF
MNADLDTAVAALSVGDYVKAAGADTRGHDVTRVGTLLAEPKSVTAQRSGLKTKAWRLFVGPAGTDPAVRATWTTLFYDSGTVELAEEPVAEEWTNDTFGSIPGVRLGTPGLTFRYGGKGGKRSTDPTEDITVNVTYTSDGRYWLRDAATGEMVTECTYARKIWWAPAPKGRTSPQKEAEPEVAEDGSAEPQPEEVAPSTAEPDRVRHCVLMRNAITGEKVPFIEHDTVTCTLHDAIALAGAYTAARGWQSRDTRVVEAVTWSPGEPAVTGGEGFVPLIGLAGAARSGKDTAASALLDVGWQRRAYGDRLKTFLYALNPWIDSVETAGMAELATEVDRHGWEAVKEYSSEARRLLQRGGTEAGREVLGQDVWVDALFRDFRTWGRFRPTVITDVRFPNEAEAILSRGGLVVQIVRPGQEQIPESGHVSENALAGFSFDATLINGSSPEALGHQLRTLAAAKGLLEPVGLKG